MNSVLEEVEIVKVLVQAVVDSLQHVASHSSLGVLIQVLLENSVVGVERIPDVVVIFNSGIESLVLNLL